jgi:enterochelin esterase-like enzyme
MKPIYSKISALIICLLVLACSKKSDDLPTPTIHPVTGNDQVTHVTIGNYKMDIFVPENYQEDKSYPVIYFNDGQSLFRGGGWGLDDKINDLVEKNIIEEVIVVGIYSDGSRTNNYTPYEDDWMKQNWGMSSPDAKKYTEDIIASIIPYVDENFSTIDNEMGRALMGYSLGGLHATWATIHYPKYFSKVAAFSPSYWVGNYEVFTEGLPNQDMKVWFDIGTAEWNYYVPFQRNLISNGLEYGENSFYYEVEGGTHDNYSWSSRVQYPLIAFYGKDKNFQPEEMKIITEVIPSQQNSGTYFLRINPVLSTKNGIKFSAGEAATYTVNNPEVGTVLADGRFGFSKEEDLHITIRYKNLVKDHTIKYSEIRVLTGG